MKHLGANYRVETERSAEMNTEKSSSKKFFLMAAAVIALALCGTKCRAQEGLLDLNQKMIRGSAVVQTWGMAAEKSSCRMASILGMCGSNEGMQTRAANKSNGIFSWRKLAGLSVDLSRINIKKEVPNKLFQIAKMFIDDVEVGVIGDFRIKLAISLQ
jgi:hypothetical protein